MGETPVPPLENLCEIKDWVRRSAKRPANLSIQLVIGLFAVRCEEFDRIRFVVAADAEQRRLLCSVLTHLTQFLCFVHYNASRLILLALAPALVLVPLFLLARLFFLTFGKSRSASWHTESPRNLYFHYLWPAT